MVLVVSGNEILQNRTALKDANLVSIRVDVGQGWNTTIRVYLNKPGFLVLLGEDIDQDELD